MSILKIDIEGSEHAMHKESCDILEGVDQVLIEIHGMCVAPLFDWFSKCGMLLFSREPNIWGCKGVRCVEYSFISATFAYKDIYIYIYNMIYIYIYNMIYI